MILTSKIEFVSRQHRVQVHESACVTDRRNKNNNESKVNKEISKRILSLFIKLWLFFFHIQNKHLESGFVFILSQFFIVKQTGRLRHWRRPDSIERSSGFYHRPLYVSRPEAFFDSLYRAGRRHCRRLSMIFWHVV